MSSMDDESRTFPLADVLSVTTPHLLSLRRMDGVCALVDWMTGAVEPTPQLLDLAHWGQLKAMTAISRKAILRQHPELGAVQPPVGLDDADLFAWLMQIEGQLGATIELKRAHEEMQEILRAVTDASKKIVNAVAEIAIGVSAAFTSAIGELGSAFADFGRALRQSEMNEVASHPDLAELDVQLQGFYGDR